MAGNARIGSLHVALGLNSAEFQTGLKKAGTQVDAFEGKFGKLGGAFKKMEGVVSSFGKGLLAGLVAGGITGIVASIGQVASSVAEVGVEAKRAGVSLKSFQELKFVAEQNKIGVGALTDGLKELNLRADEFVVTGGGSAAEAFKRLGYTASELNTKLQDPSALFTEIIGKLGQLDRAAAIRIADEIFGGSGGEQFVQLIGQGEEGIRRTIEQAHSLGIVLSDDVIAKAAEVDRKFNLVATTVGTAVKGAIVEAASALDQFLNSLGQTPSQHYGELADRIAGMRDEMELFAQATARVAPESEAGIRRIIDAVNDGTMSAGDATIALREMASINMDLFPITASLSGIIALLENVSGKAREAAAEIAAATSDPVSGGGPAATWENVQSTFFPKPRTVPGSGSGTGGGGGISEADRQAKAVQNLITGLEFERSLIGLSAVEQEKLNALRTAGAAATDKQREQISNLVEATYREREAAQAATDQMQALSDIGVNAAQSLADAFSDGKLEASELLSIVGDIVKQLLTMPTGGAGGGNWLGNIFSSLLGGLGGGGGLKLGYNLASGGTVRGPGSGKSDSIPAMLSNGEFVVNAKAAKQFAPLLNAINFGSISHLAGGGFAMAPMCERGAEFFMGKPA